MYKIVFFVPEQQKEAVKSALFAAGAGRFRNYEHCSWETDGTGQFRPLEDADPFIGTPGTVERVAEFRVEMICRDEVIASAVDALINAHPYEEPAYEVFRVFTRDDLKEDSHDQ